MKNYDKSKESWYLNIDTKAACKRFQMGQRSL